MHANLSEMQEQTTMMMLEANKREKEQEAQNNRLSRLKKREIEEKEHMKNIKRATSISKMEIVMNKLALKLY